MQKWNFEELKLSSGDIDLSGWIKYDSLDKTEKNPLFR